MTISWFCFVHTTKNRAIFEFNLKLNKKIKFQNKEIKIQDFCFHQFIYFNQRKAINLYIKNHFTTQKNLHYRKRLHCVPWVIIQEG